MGAGRVGRPGRPAELIGGQCRDNTPIVEDKGGCVPLELDTREAGRPRPSLSYVLYYIWMYCVVGSLIGARPGSLLPSPTEREWNCWFGHFFMKTKEG